MIKFIKGKDQLLLKYQPDGNFDQGVVGQRLETEGEATIRRTFTFERADIVEPADPQEPDDGERTFVFGVAEGDYYRINRRILDLKHDLLIWKQMPLTNKTFIANRDISIFGRIDALAEEPIVVGGDADGAIPLEEFNELLANFPTTTELAHYANARVTRILKDYLGTMSDAQIKLDRLLNKKRSIPATSRISFLEDYEPRKFEYVRDELQNMLKDAESYSEHDWQKLIVGFLLLIFPKYIAVLENLQIKDFYSDPTKIKDRYIDLTLVDANGTIDIVEIKKPFANCLLSRNKYRDNYTPRTELSGSVMQVEKYIFHLNKWGREGEKEILKKRKSELPPDFEIKVTNPQAMIILGRDIDFAADQKFDFEIIKRKYANIIDIMTYDDLLRRLDNIISMIAKNYAKLGAAMKKSSDPDAKDEE
jgi:hypothetical protein